MGYLLLQNILLQITVSSAFQVVSYSQSPDRKELLLGESLTLICKSDSHWERCNWIHKPTTGVTAGEESHCNMEWKYASGDVTITDCPIHSRINMVGDYNKYECGIQVTSVVEEDSGQWECEMEEYRLGDWSFGSRHSQIFGPFIVKTATSSPPVTTTTITPTSGLEEIIQTAEILENIIEEQLGEHNYNEDNDENHEEKTKKNHENHEYLENNELDQYVSQFNETNWDDDDYSTSEQNNTWKVENSEQKWHPATDQLVKEETTSVGPIIGGVITAIALVTCLLVGALVWTRKKRSITVVTMSKLKEVDDRSQTNRILEEAEYNTVMP